MKKEEKKTNKKKDPKEIEFENKAVNCAAIAVLFLAFIFFVLEIAITGKTNYGLYAIITIFNGALYLYKSIKSEKNRKLNITSAVLWLLLTGICIYGYIDHLIEISEIL